MDKLREEFEDRFHSLPMVGVFWNDEAKHYTTKDALLIPDMDFCNDMFDAFKAGYEAAKASQWISVEDELPVYGDPVLLKISGVVQHVTYMLDGADDSCDWFEPYHYEDTNAAVMNNGKLRIEWMALPEGSGDD